MGYIARTVTAENVQKAILEKMIFINLGWCDTTTAETTIYKQTHDLTDVDYLQVYAHHQMEAAAGNGFIYVYFDTTLKVTFEVTQGVTDYNTDTIDCTAVTGDEIIKITTKSGQAGKEHRVHRLNIFNMEA